MSVPPTNMLIYIRALSRRKHCSRRHCLCLVVCCFLMPKNCSYGICKNTTANSTARFFRFPTSNKDPDRRDLWAVRCKRKASDGSNWKPTADVQYIYVCSAHFITGEPWNNVDHPDYAPSQDNTTPVVNEEAPCHIGQRLQRFTNRMKRSVAKNPGHGIKRQKIESHSSCVTEDPFVDFCITAVESREHYVNHRTVVADSFFSLFSNFNSNCSKLSNTYGFTYVNHCDNVTFVKLDCTNVPTVLMSLKVDKEFSVSVHVMGKEINNNHRLWNDVQHSCSTVENVEIVLRKISSYSICIGANDSELLNLVKHNSCTAGALRKCCCVTGDSDLCKSVISVDCELLVKSASRCVKCCLVRKRILTRSKRMTHPFVLNLASCRKPNSLLTTPVKLAKLAQLAQNKRQLTRKVAVLKSKVTLLQAKCFRLIETEGENFGKSENTDWMSVVSECAETALSNFAPGSFQRIFFEQQLKYNSLKRKSSMRWHPVIIRWCLFIKSKSAVAYDGLRSFLNLPSNRTLYDYTHYTEHGVGINPKVVEQLIVKAKSQGSYTEPHKSYVGVLVDEVKIKADLVYHKTTGELIGYINLDRVTNEMLHLQNLFGVPGDKQLAQSMLVIMVRGITTSLQYPLAAYATTATTAVALYNTVWECIECLEIVAKLKVLYICCDGASANRRFFQLHTDDSEMTYKIKNPYASDGREVFFVSDPPHLLKTARNCFANSFAHSNSRKLWFHGDISWLHVVELYEQHCEMSEFRLCPKLTRKHVSLTAFSKMRVSLAAQVLSSTVANALKSMYGKKVVGTVGFVELMNKWFDIVNVKHLYEGRNKRNFNLAPFTDIADERLHWLETEFLKYFDDWKSAVEQRQGKFTDQQKKTMQLSSQTLVGLNITSKSIAGIVRTLLTAGAPFVLTNHINQDPLEQMFGHCRHKAGSNDNPTVQQACHLINNIRAVSSQAVPNTLGNTAVLSKKQLDFGPLPKRNSRQ